MKVCIVLLLATTALTAITSATNAQTSHLNGPLLKDVEDEHALVEGQLGWITEADNQLSNMR